MSGFADIPPIPGPLGVILGLTEALRKVPPARVLGRLMLSLRDQLTKEDAITVGRFHQMVRDRDPDALPSWITDAAGSVLASFGKGIVADQAAVAAALTQPWSNGHK